MSEKPEWLPKILILSGNQAETLKLLYQVFEQDIKSGMLVFGPMPVWYDRRVLPGRMYEEGFWHIISREDNFKKIRVIDSKRAERLPWCTPVIFHYKDTSVKVWDYKESKGNIRTYVWLEHFDYVVILEKQKKRLGNIAFLITAFHLDGDSKRRNLRKNTGRDLSDNETAAQ